MKILQINCVFGNGSTGKIVRDLHHFYETTGQDSFVIYGRGDNCDDKRVFKCATEIGSKIRNVLSRISGNVYGMGQRGTRRIIDRIKTLKPDVVHLHCINGFFCDIYGLLKWLGKHRVPTVLTLHAEFMYTGNCGCAFECEQWISGCQKCPNLKQSINSFNGFAPKQNWGKMKKAFETFSDNLVVTGVSEWISERASRSQILQKRTVKTVLNGLDDERFNFVPEKQPAIIEDLRKSGKQIVLYVTPYFEDANKGGGWLLQLADLLKETAVHFIVAGPTKQNYTKENVTFLGRITRSEELASLYRSADLCLLTSKQETFSMICAESLSCGTPIVGFRAGAPETISLKEFSAFVPYGDMALLKDAVLQQLENLPDKRIVSRQARQVYSYKTMADNYLAVYNELLETMNYGKH